MQMSSCEGCDAEKFSSPMPWIGRYIEAASLLCIFAMLLDTLHGFRRRKFWFPCRFFKLNAVSLTLLAVAVKLPMDLNNPMPGGADQLAKLSSNAFMSTAMVNFMPSLGLMGEKEIAMNMAALGILVITLVVNVCVELGTGVIYSAKVENILVLVFMMFLFVILSFSGLAVPKMKQDLEVQFFEAKRMMEKSESDDIEKSGLSKLEEDLKKYWVMAETGNPQFVMARSVTCSAACVICCVNFAILLEGVIRDNFFCVHIKPGSDYRRSTICISRIQSIGVALGTIASLIRWLATAKSRNDRRRCKSKIKVEKYWIEGLMEWKRSSVALQFKNHRIRKLVHRTKSLSVNICIGVQICIIAIGKLAKYISVILLNLPSLCSCSGSENKGGLRSEAKYVDDDLSKYVLHLEGEEELPQIMANESSAMGEVIETGRKLQPRILMELLLQGSKDTDGLTMLERNCVLDPHSRDDDLPSSWKMLLVTLTSIAVANPRIDQEMVEHLLCGVSQGLKYVNLIEEVLGAEEDLKRIRTAADDVWLHVFLFRRWLDNDLRKMAVDGQTSKEIVQNLAASANEYILKMKTNGNLKDGYKKWPAKLIAATAMNHICRTILLDIETKNEQTDDEEFFENISVIIADVLAACLANIPRVILMKCFSVPIEKREASVLQAALLFGETENILRFLQQHEFPSIAPEKIVHIEEWCRSIKQKHNLSVPTSTQDDLQIVTQ
nr:ATP-dependent RNA helicase [Ipomoea batatas]